MIWMTMDTKKTNTYRTYSEMVKLETFEDRFKYLFLQSIVGDFTFGGHRYLNQQLYKSQKWKKIRRQVILRDDGCDLACEGYCIYGPVYIHHLNPITIEDILNERSCVFDLENLVCVSSITHNAIHYGSEAAIHRDYIERRQNDTCLWR